MYTFSLTLVWLMLAVSFAALECFNFSMVSLWFSAGAAAAMVASLFTPVVLAQVIVFAAATLLAAVVFRRREGAERFVGHTGRITIPVCQGMPGRVRLGGMVLRAECSDELPVGTTVRVVAVNGDAVVVTPARRRRLLAKMAA